MTEQELSETIRAMLLHLSMQCSSGRDNQSALAKDHQNSPPARTWQNAWCRHHDNAPGTNASNVNCRSNARRSELVRSGYATFNADSEVNE